jgi:hypothetical protein
MWETYKQYEEATVNWPFTPWRNIPIKINDQGQVISYVKNTYIMNNRDEVILNPSIQLGEENRGIISNFFEGNNINNIVINKAQSTHTKSVHKSVSESILKLNTHYKKRNLKEALKEMKIWIDELDKKNHKKSAAIKAFYRIYNDKFTYVDSTSKITIKNALALIWIGTNDKNAQKQNILSNNDIKERRNRLIQHLYEVQRGYNISKNNVDDMSKFDRPICAGGSFNKIVNSLNGSHDCVEIYFVTKATILLKIEAVLNNLIQEIPRKIPEEKQKSMFKSWTKENGMPDELQKYIKSNLQSEVETKIQIEFKDFANKETIEQALKETFDCMKFFPPLKINIQSQKKSSMEHKKPNTSDNRIQNENLTKPKKHKHNTINRDKPAFRTSSNDFFQAIGTLIGECISPLVALFAIKNTKKLLKKYAHKSATLRYMGGTCNSFQSGFFDGAFLITARYNKAYDKAYDEKLNALSNINKTPALK